MPSRLIDEDRDTEKVSDFSEDPAVELKPDSYSASIMQPAYSTVLDCSAALLCDTGCL